MAKPYVYRGDTRVYHYLGQVEDGAVAYFEGRPPDDRWQPLEAVDPGAIQVEPVKVAAQEAAVAAEQARFDAERALKQPNKAASAADWVSFAEQHGGFEEATGTPPADATRKAIVDHYTSGPAEGDGTETGQPDDVEVPEQSQTEPPATPASTQE